MRRLTTSDAPVPDPHPDLLGMAGDAERLAAFIKGVELPFTLGVYGEWGSGKTSFVQLLVHYLRDCPGWRSLRFVDFSAWPYVTADSIWRALLLRIAEEMYEVDRSPLEGVRPDCGFVPELGRFLLGDAITLRSTPREPSAEALYGSLVEKLRKSDEIGNRSPSARIDPGKSLAALTTTFLAAANSFSPWFGGLRKFLGLDKAIDLGSVIGSASGAKRGTVELIDEIRSEIGRMFEFDRARRRERKKAEKRLVVLVDDLDRCMPQVALDVLEMIKIFFFESVQADAQCLFVVAADKTVIGRGLRARYQRAGGVADEEAAELLEDKGREYFEKIIQFSVPVPKHGVRENHRYIAAQFPGWACATDILQLALGTNPRRLKQQCSLLSYRRTVAKGG